MLKKERIQISIESELKVKAEDILQELGMTPTMAITLFYKKIIEKKGLPFEVNLPEQTKQVRRMVRLANKSPNITRIEDNETLEAWLNVDE
ncbi:type II toxin-antitoxin system RelB/DinJ family antitoxin [Enterococcus mundtii]|nr:type II toxin-antitoxin system RelB/DinJ family antitoxin [Enterococcus mundtii]